jgi:hypothetical protein
MRKFPSIVTFILLMLIGSWVSGTVNPTKVYLQDLLSGSSKDMTPGATTKVPVTESGTIMYIAYTSFHGSPGIQGTPGIPGASINWKGIWSSSTTYHPLDGVFRLGSSYRALFTNSVVDPATDTYGAYWSPIAIGGSSIIASSLSYSNISAAIRLGGSLVLGKSFPEANDYFTFWDYSTGGQVKIPWSFIKTNLLNAMASTYVPNTIAINGQALSNNVVITTITGNAGTATALATTPSDCASGQVPSGILANGNATGCFTPSGNYSLPTATSGTLGGVKPDGSSVINVAGAISVTPASIGLPANLVTMSNLSSATVRSARNATMLSAPSLIPNGSTVVTQSTGDNTTKPASNAFVNNSITAASSNYATASQGALAASALQPFPTEAQGNVYAGPVTGSGSPLFRTLTSTDISFAATTSMLSNYLTTANAASGYESLGSFHNYSTGKASQLSVIIGSISGKQAALSNYSCAGSSLFKKFVGNGWVCSIPSPSSGGTTMSVTGFRPISSSQGTNPVISIIPATDSLPGSMSASDKIKVDAYPNYAGPYVPQATTVNTHALSGNIVVSASDLTVGTLPHAQLPNLVSGDIPDNAANTSGSARSLSASLIFKNFSAAYRANFGEITPSTIGAATSAQGALAASALQPYGSQLANYVLASPNGSSGALSPRALVTADVPNLPWGKITSGVPSYLLTNQSITLSGDATGSGTTSIPVTLVNSGVTFGSYSYAHIVVNTKGIITHADRATSPSITVGSTTTGVAGSNAAITNSGSSLKPVLNFAIPRGFAGYSGAQGAAGAGISVGSDGQYGWLTSANTSNYSMCGTGLYGFNWISGNLYECLNGSNILFNGGYTLPIASSSVLGGVKPDGTSILNTSGAISATAASVGAIPAGSLGSASTLAATNLTNGLFCTYSSAGSGKIKCNKTPAAGGSMVYPSGSGIPVVTSGASWNTTVAAPAGTIVGTTDIQVLTNKIIDEPITILGPSLSSSAGSGLNIGGNSGLTAGSVYDTAMALAKANATTTMPAMCLATSSSNCMFSGVYKFSGSQGWTAGQLLYPSSATAGALVTTAPGNLVQIFGTALASDTMLIMPTLTMTGSGSPSPFVSDTLADTNGTLLTTHSPQTGGPWYAESGNFTIYGNQAYNSGSYAYLYANATPPTANYTVESDFYVASVASEILITGRMNTSAQTFYAFGYYAPGTEWILYKVVANAWTTLGIYSQTLTPGNTYHGLLTINGSSISASVGGTQVIAPVTDTGISATGKAGVYGDVSTTSSTGIHLLNFKATGL